jgi:hypothetical protein
MSSQNPYRAKMINVTVYLGYAQTGLDLRNKIKSIAQQNGKSVCAYLREIIQKSLILDDKK